MTEKLSRKKYFVEYLTLKLASVLAGVKPSFLLSLRNWEKFGQQNHFLLWEKDRKEIIKDLGLSFRELKETCKGIQVLFYNQDMLFDLLMQPEHQSFLENFGYSRCHKLDDFLELLKDRYNSPFFPHEIGIFLGFPLKDVMGFIDKRNTLLTKRGRWLVFGEPEESLELMEIHKKAEKIFFKFIKNNKNPLHFSEHINAFIKRKTSLTMLN